MSSTQFLVDADQAWCEEATQIAIKAADAVSRYKGFTDIQRATLKRAVGVYAVARTDALRNALPATHSHLALLGWVNTSKALAAVLRVLHDATINPSDIPSWTGPTRTSGDQPLVPTSLGKTEAEDDVNEACSVPSNVPHATQGSLFG